MLSYRVISPSTTEVVGATSTTMARPAVWMDVLRGIAVIAIVLHHWFLFMLPPIPGSRLSPLEEFSQAVAGTFVHLFFVLSGCGLTISYFKRRHTSWGEWARSRFRKIVHPYWVIVSLTFLLVNLLHTVNSTICKKGYSWATLLSYLTFTRNFFPLGWDLNSSLWFMPVIVGLYLLFPILIKLLEKYGPIVLMLVSAVVTYGSISVGVLTGYSVSHQAAIPTFHLVEVSFGMLVGYWFCFSRERFQFFFSTRFFLIGLLFYCASWAMMSFWTLGDVYNDFFTAVGVFAFSIQACRWLNGFSLEKLTGTLLRASRVSYLAYLIHLPLIVYVIEPLLLNSRQVILSPFLLPVLGIVYLGFVFASASMIAPWFSGISSGGGIEARGARHEA